MPRGEGGGAGNVHLHTLPACLGLPLTPFRSRLAGSSEHRDGPSCPRTQPWTRPRAPSSAQGVGGGGLRSLQPLV